jgi:hypothetical protein
MWHVLQMILLERLAHEDRVTTARLRKERNFTSRPDQTAAERCQICITDLPHRMYIARPMISCKEHDDMILKLCPARVPDD